MLGTEAAEITPFKFSEKNCFLVLYCRFFPISWSVWSDNEI